MKLQTKDLIGAALDWATAKAENDESAFPWIPPFGYGHGPAYAPKKYSTDWALAGALLEKHNVRLDCAWRPGPWKGAAKIDGVTAWEEGTPQQAICRCVVAAKLGPEIDVPAELCE